MLRSPCQWRRLSEHRGKRRAMKTIKPMKLGILTRNFEWKRQCHFGVSVLAGFRFGEPSRLLSEIAMWTVAPEELGEESLDIGMPKLRAEFLVKGSAFPPGGAPATTCPVRVSIGDLSKQLYVIGDRHWKGKKQSDPQPFTEMPIDWETAYGGPDFDENPLGKGHAPVQTEHGAIQFLPNVESPGKLIKSPKDRPAPSAFRGIDYAWPQRFSKLGTYDNKWFETDYPGYAKDIDWTVWNVAQADQQQPDPFRGDEAFVIENMHPEQPRLEGQLPGIRARCFVTRRVAEDEQFHEIDTRLTTVWFFPHARMGVLIFQGSHEVEEDDGHDIVRLMLAAEDLDNPKPFSHYETVLEKRLDKEKGATYSLSDSDLMPPTPAGETYDPFEGVEDRMSELRETEGLMRQNMKRGQRTRIEDARARAEAAGLDPDEYAPWPEDDDEIEVPDDPDALIEFMEKQEEESAKLAKEAERQNEEARARLREACEERGLDFEVYTGQKRDGPPPIPSPGEQLARIQQEVEDARASGVAMVELDDMLTDPEFRERLDRQAESAAESYRQSVHLLDPAQVESKQRGARRDLLVQSLESGRSLADVDLTGADLSGLDLQGADLQGAFLECANLEDVNLEGAKLTRAVLAHANLRRANMRGAALPEANLGASDLTGAILESCDLREAILGHANLTQANLRQADLTDADLMETIFDRTDMTGVRAEGISWMNVEFKQSCLDDAQLKGSTFLESNVDGVSFQGATLEKSTFMETSGCGANFQDAKLSNARFVIDCDFSDANFIRAQLNDSNLRETKLRNADFSEAELTGSDLSGADLSDAKLYRINAPGSLLVRTDLRNATLQSANLMNAIMQKADIRGADLRGANLFAADFALVRADSATNLEQANQKRARANPQRVP